VIGAATLDNALRSSTMLLVAEHRRLREELDELEERIMQMRTGASSATLEAQMAEAEARAAELRRAIADKHEQERAVAAKAAAKAVRERLTGHSRALAAAHEAKLVALETAESHAAAMVQAINAGLAAEAAERAAARALAEEMGVKTNTLQLSEAETVRRLVGGICDYLSRVSACRMRRLAYLVLPDHPHARTAETWGEREARNTSSSVEVLLATAEAQREAA
jgi:hypothetical protein